MSDIKPALTAEEWEASEEYGFAIGRPDILGLRHGIAARCLHDQPYGFTREDVELLVEAHNGYDSGDFLGRYGQHPAERLRHLISRIEALLPPEEE